MSHEEAIERYAVAAYVLGELVGREREEFEEHMFECALCKEEIEGVTSLVDKLKKSLAGDPAYDARFHTKHATAAYVLGDLTGSERESFESHMTGCRVCFNNVNVGVKVLANFRRAMDGGTEVGRRRVFALQFSRWFDLAFRD